MKKQWLLVCLVLGLTARLVLAEADEKGGDFAIKAVTVTAEKREADRQKIPGSIHVVTDLEMVDAGVDSFEALANQTPDFHFYDWGANSHNFLFMRGIGAVNNNPAVGVFLDGVGLFEPGMFNYPLFDLERIEVLRGPQGTLYGRNTMAGVINMVTRRPDNEARMGVRAGTGNFGLQAVSAFGGGAIIEDRLFMGGAGFYKKRDGFQENKSPGFSGTGGNHVDGMGGRLKLLYDAGADLDITLNLDHQAHEGGSFPVRRMTDWAATGLKADDPHTYSHNFEENRSESFMTGSSVKVEWDTAFGLVTALTGNRTWKTEEINDQDFSPLDVTHYRHEIDQDQLTQELRILSPDDGSRLRWLAGIYLFKREKTEIGAQYFDSQAALFGAMPGMISSKQSDYTDTGHAIFGEISYWMAASLKLTVGLRYDAEENKQTHETKSFVPGIGWMSATVTKREADSDDTLPKISLAWYRNSHFMAYSSVTRGYRGGGFNNAAPSQEDYRFEPEYSLNTEVGFKSQWLGDRLMLNVTGYQIDIKDQQLSFVMPTGSSNTYVANAGKSISRGVELESRYRPAMGLDLIAGVAVNEGTFVDYRDPVSGVDYKDNRLPLAPTHNYNLAGQYRRPLQATLFGRDRGLDMFVRLELVGTGKIYWDAANELEQSPYQLTNIKVGLESDSVDLHLWAKNVWDVEYQEMVFQRTGMPLLGQDGAPMTFGVDLAARF